MLEKRFKAVPPQLFTANGTASGVVKIANSKLFRVKQVVILKSNVAGPLELEIKNIPDSTTLIVGPRNKSMTTFSDVSGFLVSDSAYVFANEQHRPSIPQEEIIRAEYEEEPIVAQRVIGVDPNGSVVNWSVDGITPSEFDDVQITRDIDEDMTEVEFFLGGVSITKLEISYNTAKSLIRVKKV